MTRPLSLFGAIRECWHKTVNLFEHKHPKTAKATTQEEPAKAADKK